MKNNILTLVLLACVFVSCKYSPDQGLDNKTLLSFNLSNNREELIKDFYAGSYFIPSETTREALIGEIKGFKQWGNCIYMSDGRKLVSFSIDDELYCAKIKSTINRFGRGPGEYIEIEDFCISDKYIFIYDIQKVNIIIFLRTFSFIRTTSVLSFATKAIY